MNWTIQQDNHASGVLSIFESDGVPVLVKYVGRYPTATCDDGRSTKTDPHILISISRGSISGAEYFSGVTVEAVGRWEGAVRKSLPVFSMVYYTARERTATPDVWVEIGKRQLPEAMQALASIDAQYAAANEFADRASAYTQPLSRGQYVAAASELGVECLSDAECLSYGVKYGVFSFPEYSPQYVAAMHLAALRWRQLQCEQKPRPTPAVARPPAKTGQLWEPCEVCGAEPVYMPLHLCEACWPTGGDR